MKKNIIYLFCAAIILSSCSSAYRSSQTPDDVYYSPAKKAYPANEYNQYQDDQYESYTTSSDDDYLRMKVRDHYRWSNLDDFDYWYDSRYYYNNYYSFYNPGYYPWGSYLSLGNYYNPYTSFLYNPWNSVYCPAYTVVYYKNPQVYYGTRTANSYHLSTYSNRNYNNRNMPLQNSNRSNVYINNNSSRRNDSYINQNQNRNNSNPVRFNNNNNNSNSNFNSGSSHNMSSGSSGGGGMSRAPRGGH